MSEVLSVVIMSDLPSCIHTFGGNAIAHKCVNVVAIVLLCGLLSSNAASRNAPSKEIVWEQPILSVSDSDRTSGLHDIGRLVLGVNNSGYFAGGQFPKGQPMYHLFVGSIWIGAVKDRDTLVSVTHDGWNWLGREFSADPPPLGDMKHRSIIDPDSPEYEGAVSEQDFIGTYTDTATVGIPADYFGFRPHIPLNVEITQSSYAWSYDYAEDFILFNLEVKNIGSEVLNDLYLGLYIDGDVSVNEDRWDDVCGFVRHVASPFGCGFVDTINSAWIADNDGDPIDGAWLEQPRMTSMGVLEGSIRHVTATTILHAPAADMRHSFNWWIGNQDMALDFGPRRRANFRDFRTGGLGTPEGDVNKYHVLSNHEFDYDQVLTASVSQLDTTWLYPDQGLAADYSDGFDTRYLLSYGSFNVYPGQTLPLAFAYVAGENFHNDVNNLENLQPESYDPIAYYANLDFSDLALNALWARWVYDNPGVDTDNDGYFGEFRVCIYDSMLTDTGWMVTAADTQWHHGDGVPDWRGSAPPPAPYLWVTPLVAALHVRINGERSETESDFLTHIPEFEGYRVYFGRDDRPTSLSLIASYDLENYDKYVWNSNRYDELGQPDHGWDLYDIPYTLDSLRCLYGRGMDPCNDSLFDPLDFHPGDPYSHPRTLDSLFYFRAHDFNMYAAIDEHSIRKTFPNQRDPRTLTPDDLTDDDYTDDGYLKFFEYELTIENLLPTVPYFVNVTAFDFGSPKSSLASLETSKTIGVKEAYPFNSAAEAAGTTDEIYIYPNPYRINGDYRARGFEGRNEIDRPHYRVRAIHFTNLPPRCTIRIHSLDGDLVRELQHDIDPTLGTSREHEWDLITRNTQMIVTGLYYWTVESPDGSTQMGKLVILM